MIRDRWNWRRRAAALALAAAVPGPAAADPPPAPSTRDLDFLVGRWSGESVFRPAFRPGVAPVAEHVASECLPVMAGSYIQCLLTLTRADGRARMVMILWNYNEVSSDHEALVLSSNYGGKSAFAVRWDAGEGAWIGHVPTRTEDGRPATERLVYRVSPDGLTLESFEMIRPDGRPEAPWTRTFEYRLHRLDR